MAELLLGAAVGAAVGELLAKLINVLKTVKSSTGIARDLQDRLERLAPVVGAIKFSDNGNARAIHLWIWDLHQILRKADELLSKPGGKIKRVLKSGAFEKINGKINVLLIEAGAVHLREFTDFRQQWTQDLTELRQQFTQDVTEIRRQLLQDLTTVTSNRREIRTDIGLSWVAGQLHTSTSLKVEREKLSLPTSSPETSHLDLDNQFPDSPRLTSGGRAVSHQIGHLVHRQLEVTFANGGEATASVQVEDLQVEGLLVEDLGENLQVESLQIKRVQVVEDLQVEDLQVEEYLQWEFEETEILSGDTTERSQHYLISGELKTSSGAKAGEFQQIYDVETVDQEKGFRTKRYRSLKKWLKTPFSFPWRHRKMGLLGLSDIPRKYRISYNSLYRCTNGFENLIAVGGTARVCKGVLDHVEVAVKCFKSELYETLLQEVQVNIKMGCHPNLVEMKGVCFGETECFLVFKLVDGGTLLENLCRPGDAGWRTKLAYPTSVTWGERKKIALGIALGVALGLDHLHSKLGKCHIFHLDIKPTNILLERDHTVKIADFGSSQIFEEGESSNLHSVMTGTVGYVAPEALDGSQPTAKTDVFSYGVLLVDLISGGKGIIGGKYWKPNGYWKPNASNAEWARMVRQGDIDPLATIDPSLRASVEVEFEDSLLDDCRMLMNLATDCMEADPRNRPDMATILEAFSCLREEIE